MAVEEGSAKSILESNEKDLRIWFSARGDFWTVECQWIRNAVCCPVQSFCSHEANANLIYYCKSTHLQQCKLQNKFIYFFINVYTEPFGAHLSTHI